MLPDEMWEEVLKHLELSDLLRLQRVSKRWKEIITRIIQRGSKWYEKCVAEIPEDMWSSMLNHQTHPKIRCENFHRAKMHSEIWMTMYKSWIGWNNLTEKSTSIEDIEVINDMLHTAIFVAVTGNIMAVVTRNLLTSFYDISESTVNPIYQVNDGVPISDVVLCRNGSDVMAVLCSDRDLRYWDLKTKKKIHQAEFRHPGRILSAHFDYFYSLCCDGETWILNVEQFVSGTVRSVRSVTFTDARYAIKAMRPEGDKVLLYMDSYNGNCNKFYVNLPDNRFEALSVHEVVHDEFSQMHMAINACFKIFKPCVATYVPRHSRFFCISVNAKPWKTYDIEQDLGISGLSSVVFYHVGLLIVAIDYDPFYEAEVRIYSIENINKLDNLDFKSLKAKTLKFTSPSIDDLFVTEYNTCQYLLVVGNKKIHIVKFD